MEKPKLIIPVRFDSKSMTQHLLEADQIARLSSRMNTESFTILSNAANSPDDTSILHESVSRNAGTQASLEPSEPLRHMVDSIKRIARNFTGRPPANKAFAGLEELDHASTFPLIEVAKDAEIRLSLAESLSAREEFQSRADFFRERDWVRLSQPQAMVYHQRIVESLKSRRDALTSSIEPIRSQLQSYVNPQDLDHRSDYHDNALRMHDRSHLPISQIMHPLNRFAPQGNSSEEARRPISIMPNQLPGEGDSVIERGFRLDRDKAHALLSNIEHVSHSTKAGRVAKKQAHLVRRSIEQRDHLRNAEHNRPQAGPRFAKEVTSTKHDWTFGTEPSLASMQGAQKHAFHLDKLLGLRDSREESTANGELRVFPRALEMNAHVEKLLKRVAVLSERMVGDASNRPLVAPPPNPAGRM
jgi:hypothetical protein